MFNDFFFLHDSLKDFFAPLSFLIGKLICRILAPSNSTLAITKRAHRAFLPSHNHLNITN